MTRPITSRTTAQRHQSDTWCRSTDLRALIPGEITCLHCIKVRDVAQFPNFRSFAGKRLFCLRMDVQIVNCACVSPTSAVQLSLTCLSFRILIVNAKMHGLCRLDLICSTYITTLYVYHVRLENKEKQYFCFWIFVTSLLCATRKMQTPLSMNSGHQ